MSDNRAAREPAQLESIDCNTAWSRAVLRVSVLGIPFLIGGLSLGPPGIMIAIAVVAAAATCWSNKLSISQDVVMMPAWHYQTFKTASITKVTVEDFDRGPSYIVFHLEADGANDELPELKRISTRRLRGQKSIDLVRLLDKYCPNVVLDEHTRARLLGTIVEGNHSDSTFLEIPYERDDRARNLLKLTVSYEKYFWRVYLGIFLIPIGLIGLWLLMLPLLVMAGLRTEHIGMASMLFKDVFMFTGVGIGLGAEAYFGLVTQPAIVAIMSTVLIFILYRVVYGALQPNKLRLDSNGLKLQKVALNTVIYKSSFAWSEFDRITLNKPHGTSIPEQWEIQLSSARRRHPLKLKLRAVKGERDRARLLKALERWTPEITRDHELIEALSPAQKQSYTELWLQSLSTPPKRERLSPLAPGLIVKSGQYTILRQIGAGGQAIAYLAKADLCESYLVVKEFVLPVFVDKSARKQALEKFESDARLLQNLDHPQVVKLLDYFIEDHRAYLILEHITGRTLRRIVDEQGPMSNEQVLSLAKQMCTILDYLHSLEPSLVHRDFAPDNLILNDDGILKLIDFNVAHQKSSHTVATVVGKHAYLPPEQFRGKPVPQSDLYAMGATLHFLLTGEDPEPVSESHPLLQNSNVAVQLDNIVASCTRLDLKKRYQDAKAIAGDLALFNCNESLEKDDESLILKVPQTVAVNPITHSEDKQERGD